MANIVTEHFGKLSDGRCATLFTLTNSRGNQIKVCDYGCRLQSWVVKGNNGTAYDIVLGYDDVSKYERDTSCMGGIIGRHANRIENGRVTIGGRKYQLECNTGTGNRNHIHGGSKGFHYQLWEREASDKGISFSHVSPDMTAGFPGNMKVIVRYDLTDDDELVIDYTATSDADTICNLTNHAYFNLDGHNSGAVLDQQLQIFADEFTWADQESLPTGEICSVSSTPMDFRKLKKIGADIEADYEQLKWGLGHDHNYVVPNWKKDGRLHKIAYVQGAASGLGIEAYTTLPGMQFYTGNYLDGSITGKDGTCYNKRSGFCLEMQYFPNSPAHKNFPQPLLLKGEVYEAKTVYKLILQQD